MLTNNNLVGVDSPVSVFKLKDTYPDRLETELEIETSRRPFIKRFPIKAFVSLVIRIGKSERPGVEPSPAATAIAEILLLRVTKSVWRLKDLLLEAMLLKEILLRNSLGRREQAVSDLGHALGPSRMKCSSAE